MEKDAIQFILLKSTWNILKIKCAVLVYTEPAFVWKYCLIRESVVLLPKFLFSVLDMIWNPCCFASNIDVCVNIEFWQFSLFYYYYYFFQPRVCSTAREFYGLTGKVGYCKLPPAEMYGTTSVCLANQLYRND